MPNLAFRYHHFPDRAAFEAAVDAAFPGTDTDPGPVTRLGESDVLEVGTLSFTPEGGGDPVQAPGFHVCAAWRGEVPHAFQASVVPVPEGAPVFAGMLEAIAGENGGGGGPVTEPVPTGPRVPRTIRILQFLKQGRTAGLLSYEEALAAAKTGDVPASIQAIFNAVLTPEQAKDATLDWAGMIELDRSSPLLTAVAAASGMSEAEMDLFFIEAAQR